MHDERLLLTKHNAKANWQGFYCTVLYFGEKLDSWGFTVGSRFILELLQQSTASVIKSQRVQVHFRISVFLEIVQKRHSKIK